MTERLREECSKLRSWRDIQNLWDQLGCEDMMDESRLAYILRKEFHLYAVRHPDPAARQLLKQVDDLHLEPNVKEEYQRPTR